MQTNFLLLINGGTKTMYVPILKVDNMDDAVKASIDFFLKTGVTGARTMHVVEICKTHNLVIEHLEAMKEKRDV